MNSTSVRYNARGNAIIGDWLDQEEETSGRRRGRVQDDVDNVEFFQDDGEAVFYERTGQGVKGYGQPSFFGRR